MGSPTVDATISSPTANSELAARLLDVAPDGSETLVDRQLYRPMVGTARQVFQLHPSGHLFAAGHVAKLELLPKDAGGSTLNSYGRAANGQGDITVSKLDFQIPVLEGPGAAAGQVIATPALALPCGQEIAQQYSSAAYVRATLGTGKLVRKGRSVKVPVDSAPSGTACKVQVRLVDKKGKKGKKGKNSAALSKKGKKKGKSRILGKGTATIDAGQVRHGEGEALQGQRQFSREEGPGRADHDRSQWEHRPERPGEGLRQEGQEAQEEVGLAGQ